MFTSLQIQGLLNIFLRLTTKAVFRHGKIDTGLKIMEKIFLVSTAYLTLEIC